MTELITLEIYAEASGQIAAPAGAAWLVVGDLSRRPNLTSHEPLAGVWPEETAQVRVRMDKGVVRMTRTETVIRCVPEAQLLVKIEAPEFGSTAWLEHRIEDQGAGCRLTLGVIAIATFPRGAGPASRSEYAAMTQAGLQAAVDEYRQRIEEHAN